MGSVDVSYKLRRTHRVAIGLKNRNWGWSLLFLILRFMVTNAYVVFGSIKKKQNNWSARANGYHRMNLEDQLNWIVLILMLLRMKRIRQQVIRGKHHRLCHPSQWVHGAIMPQRKQRWSPSTWLIIPFKNQDLCCTVLILHWTNFQINHN